MKGLLLYSQKDYLKNQEFANWIIEEMKKRGASMEVLLIEETHKLSTPLDTYDFIINRSRSYHWSLLFEMNQIRVYNNSQITLLGNNKLAGYAYAKQMGYAFAPVYLPNTEVSTKIIQKPIYGHGGQGIRVAKNISGWHEDYVNQKLCSDIVGDIRFYILDNRIHSAVLRKPKQGFLSNFSQGGQIELYAFSPKEEAYVLTLLKGLQADYIGVDFLLSTSGELIFNEIEDAVGSRMLSQLGRNTIVPLWCEQIIKNTKCMENK